MIHILRLLPFFGKSLDEHCQRRKQRFQKCYAVKIWDTLENLSNSACLLLSVSSTNILGRVGNAKVLTWLQIIASCHTMVFIVKHTISGIERGRGLSTTDTTAPHVTSFELSLTFFVGIVR